MSTTKEFKKYWKEHYAHLVGEYYPWPEIHCHCSCNGHIKVTSGHFYTGLPNYINHHHPVTQETKQKIRETNTGKPHNDMRREIMKEGRWNTVPGPEYYVSFRDFIKTGVYLYHRQYMVISRHVRKVLKVKELDRRDVNLFCNFVIGHTINELAFYYGMTDDGVYLRLTNFRKQFPRVFQESRSFAYPTNIYYGGHLRVGGETLIQWFDAIHQF